MPSPRVTEQQGTNVLTRIFVFSGAGLSQESGLETFRSTDGLWANYDINVVCNIKTWQKNYELVHEFYDLRREEIGKVKPNYAHMAIASWEKDFEVINVTTNIDDLLERAGCSNVTHLHGKATELVDTSNGKIINIGYGSATSYITEDMECDIKPNVVFFGEDAPKYEIYYNILSSLTGDDIVVNVGTSSQVVDFENHLRGTPPYKIRLNPSPIEFSMFGESVFDFDLQKTAVHGIDQVTSIITSRG